MTAMMRNVALHKWLANADQFYIDAKILNSHLSVRNGAHILLWYAVEHFVKLIILQKEMASASAVGDSLEEIDEWIDSAVRQKYSHNPRKLIKRLLELYPGLLTDDEQKNLKELHKFFDSRYVSFKPKSMSINYKTIDASIFKIRDITSPTLSESIIDKIDVYRNDGKNIRPDLKLAYKDNPAFRGRSDIGYTTSFDDLNVLAIEPNSSK